MRKRLDKNVKKILNIFYIVHSKIVCYNIFTMSKFAKKLSYFSGLIAKHGWIGLGIKAIEKKTDPVDREYRNRYGGFLPSEEELERQREAEKKFSYRPLISIVVPTYRTQENFLRELIDSVLRQSYSNWELCIADGSGLGAAEVEHVTQTYEDSRIRYVRLAENGGISRNTNAGFAVAEGTYIGLLDHDDVLAANALYEVVSLLNERTPSDRPRLFYSDEDKVPADLSYHYEPHFKPDYNEELLNHYNYICHFLVFDRELLDFVEGLDPAYDGAQDYDFVLRCTERLSKEQIAHIPKVLYHWRVHETSTAGFSGHKDYAYEAAERAVQAHFDRLSVPSRVLPAPGREYVSVDRLAEMEPQNFVCMLGAGIRPLDVDWSARLAKNFSGHKDPVGMVGGRLLTRKSNFFGHVVACGYTFDRQGNVQPFFAGWNSFKKGYFRRGIVPQQVSACSLDFCVVDRGAMERVGGVDQTLPPLYRDLDFAFRLRQAGYQVILDAGVAAATAKTAPKSERTADDMHAIRQKFFARWQEYIEEGDPFYNENIRCIGSL
jgi:glycosyltransferase involved in cell wall biosynthesis